MTVTIERVMDLADRSAKKAARGDYHLCEELRQEAAIKGWKALVTKPDAPESYVQRAIINGINDYFRGHTTGGGVGVGKGNSRHRPELETELSEVMQDKLIGVCDEYPCLVVKNDFVVSMIKHLTDPLKIELMYRKYVFEESDEVIREAMGLSISQANIHHRWAVQQMRDWLEGAVV